MERSGFAVPLQHNLGLQCPCADSLCLTVHFKTAQKSYEVFPPVQRRAHNIAVGQLDGSYYLKVLQACEEKFSKMKFLKYKK